MSLLSATIDHLFLHIKTSSLDMSELRNELQQMLQQATSAPREDLDGALQRLEELVGSLPLLPAALIALGCGALVEYGGSPSAVTPVIFQRTGEALQRAALFVSACKEAARAQPSHAAENEDAEQCVEMYGEQCRNRHQVCEGAITLFAADENRLADTFRVGTIWPSAVFACSSLLARSVEARVVPKDLKRGWALPVSLAHGWLNPSILSTNVWFSSLQNLH